MGANGPSTVSASSARGDAAVAGSTVTALWKRTRGNALFVRELVRHGVDRGLLAEDGGVWRWRGRVQGGTRLAELGWAGDELLDSYEAERRPVAEYAVARSADPRGSYREPDRELPADLGGRIPHVWVGDRSTLDLLGTGYTLFAGRDADLPSLDTAAPVTVRRLDPIVA